ncbi:Alpha/Beta hydrolase protein [Mycena galopus ATCC 62051]|nr:Alpha/Beta hydrolase protein [Mycena galopus ATCC 62051]
MRAYSYLFALSLFFSVSTASLSPIVSLDYGTFLGAKDGNLTKFLGVPFAEPAVRFERPQTPKVLTGVQNATSFGPACPQQELNPAIPVPTNNYTSISEACLMLDVFTPAANSSAKLPVFVPSAQAFSGGFAIGSPFDLDMRPTVEYSILLGEPVIIVAPNYRLNAFGFLSGKEASAAGITNLGMRDQIFALEWVQKHISAFGGDPDRVVLGGISAGAISTSILIQSNKQISPHYSLSGAPLAVPSQADGQQYYDSLVAANNCTTEADTLECLRRVPYDVFLATVNQTPDIFSYQGLSFIWAPHVDGDVIVQNPVVSVSQGGFLKIPLMMGNDDDEGTLFALAQTNITTDAGFMDYLEAVPLPNATAAQISQVMQLYPQDPAQGSPFGTGDANQLTPEFKRMAAFEGDLIIGPRRFFLKYASSTQNTWSWLNKRGKSTPYLGASHTSDTFLFFPANISALTNDTGINALSTRAFLNPPLVFTVFPVNFINTLDPNVSAAPACLSNNASIFWPKWQTPSVAGSSSLLTFSDPLVVNITADDFRAEQIQYLNELNLNGASS